MALRGRDRSRGGTATGAIWSCCRPLVPRTAAVPAARSVAALQRQAGRPGLLRRAWTAQRALPASAAHTRGPMLPASGLRAARSLGTVSEAGSLRRAPSKKPWFFGTAEDGQPHAGHPSLPLSFARAVFLVVYHEHPLQIQ